MDSKAKSEAETTLSPPDHMSLQEIVDATNEAYSNMELIAAVVIPRNKSKWNRH